MYDLKELMEDVLNDIFASGYSLSELGRICGVDRRTLGYYKNGTFKIENMTLGTAQKLIDFYPDVNGPFYLSEIEHHYYIVRFPELMNDVIEENGNYLFKGRRDYFYWKEVAEAVHFVIVNNIPLRDAVSSDDYLNIFKKVKKNT